MQDDYKEQQRRVLNPSIALAEIGKAIVEDEHTKMIKKKQEQGPLIIDEKLQLKEIQAIYRRFEVQFDAH